MNLLCRKLPHNLIIFSFVKNEKGRVDDIIFWMKIYPTLGRESSINSIANSHKKLYSDSLKF